VCAQRIEKEGGLRMGVWLKGCGKAGIWAASVLVVARVMAGSWEGFGVAVAIAGAMVLWSAWNK